MAKYRETPEEIDRLPPGIPYIIGNEAAERFSYYGMRALLLLYMTAPLASGGLGFDGHHGQALVERGQEESICCEH